MRSHPSSLPGRALTCLLCLGPAALAPAQPQPGSVDPHADAAPPRAQGQRPLFQTPMVCDIRIDGRDDDWRRRGRIDATLATGPRITLDEQDLSATLRAGWDERGLLLLIRVTDDTPDEATNKIELHEMDSVEFLLSNASTDGERVRCTVAPGRAEGTDEPRARVWDRRRDPELRRTPVRIELASRSSAHGYTLEALVPWDALGIEPRAGVEVGFDLVVHDADGTHRRDHLFIKPHDRLDDDEAPRCRLRLTPMRHELAHQPRRPTPALSPLVRGRPGASGGVRGRDIIT